MNTNLQESTLLCDELSLSVQFIKIPSLNQLSQAIGFSDNSQVILWYFGCHGLKKHGVEFYGKEILGPILQKTSHQKIHLYDLTGWAAFSNIRSKITSQSSCIHLIEELLGPKVSCLASATILQRISQEKTPKLLSFFQNCLDSEKIINISKDHPKVGITLGEVFSDASDLLKPFLLLDTAKAYSRIQYLEAFYIIDALLMRNIENNSGSATIIFALPADELKYYLDDDGTFEKDLYMFLRCRLEADAYSTKALSILFIGFPYGECPSDRPYNGPGEILKKRDINLNLLLGRNLHSELL